LPKSPWQVIANNTLKLKAGDGAACQSRSLLFVGIVFHTRSIVTSGQHLTWNWQFRDLLESYRAAGQSFELASKSLAVPNGASR
jgi:hypothetical protein